MVCGGEEWKEELTQMETRFSNGNLDNGGDQKEIRKHFKNWWKTGDLMGRCLLFGAAFNSCPRKSFQRRKINFMRHTAKYTFYEGAFPLFILLKIS